MNRRTAHLIRCGILAARDPDLRQYVHLAPRLVREACRREMKNAEWREVLKCRELRNRLEAERSHSDGWDGYSLPQRVIIGIDSATINAEQAEHLRRFSA